MRLFDAEGRLGLNDSALVMGLRNAERKVRSTMNRIDGMSAEADVDVDTAGFHAEMKAAEARLAAWEKRKVSAKVTADVHEANRGILKARQDIAALQRDYERGVKLNVDVDPGGRGRGALRGLMKLLAGTRREGESALEPLEKVGRVLNDMRLTLGPLSLSLRNAVIGMGALAPVIVSLIGTAAGLAGVLGHSLVAAAGLGGSALLGFGGIAAGVAGVLASHPKVMENVGKSVAKLGKVWKDATFVPKVFGDAVKEGLETARALIPIVGRQSSLALGSMSKAASGFFELMRRPENSNALLELFSNTRKAIRPLTAGIGNLGATWVKVARSFSRHFPQIGKDFENWTEDLLESASNSQTLNRNVDQLMKSLGSVGGLLKDGGKLMVEFFGASAPAGRRIIGDIREQFQEWTDWLQKPKNRKALRQWIDDNWGTFKRAIGVLGELLEFIDSLADAARPATNALLDLADAIAAVFAAAGGSGIGGGLLTGLFALTGIGVAIRSLKFFGGLLKGIGRSLYPFSKPLPNPFRNWKQPKVDWGGLEKQRPRTPLTVKVREVVDRSGGRGARPPSIKPTVDRAALGRVTDDIAKAGAKGGAAAGAAAGRSGAAGFARGVARGVPGATLANVLLEAIFPETLGTDGAQRFIDSFGQRAYRSIDALGPKLAPAMRNAMHNMVQMGEGDDPFGRMFRGTPQQVERQFNRAALNVANTMKGLVRTVSGQRLIVRVATAGDDRVRTTFNRLAQTKIGRKVIQIAERGGKAGFRMLQQLSKTKIGQKVMNIIEKGGKPAQQLVRALGKEKIRDKIMRVLEKGGDGALGKIRKLAGIKIPPKKAQIGESGFSGVMSKIRQIARATLGTATKTLVANDQVSGVMAGIAAVTSLGTAVKTIVTRQIGGGRARGGVTGEGDPVDARTLATAARAPRVPETGGRVLGPRLLNNIFAGVTGEEQGNSEMVIPMNPAYRGRALGLLADAASNLGVPGFKRGTPPSAEFLRKRDIRRRKHDAKSYPNRGKASAKFTGPVDNAENKAERMEHGFENKQRGYHIAGDAKPLIGDNGVLLDANVKWHTTQLEALITDLRAIVKQWEHVADVINEQMTKLRKALKQMQGWNPRSDWGKSRKSDYVGQYRMALDDLTERRRDANWTADDRRMDITELKAEKAAVGAATPETGESQGIELTEAASGGSDRPSFSMQLASLSAARMELFREFGSNFSPFQGGGAGGSTAIGALTGAAAGGREGAAAAGAPTGGAEGNVYGQGGSDSAGKSLTVNNYFQKPPPDSHIFSAGVAHDLKALI